VPFALVLAIVVAVAELIPIFGPILSGVVAVAVAVSSGGILLGLPSAVWVAGGFIVLHQLENHLLYPLVVKKVVGVPPLLVILALIAGLQLAGFLGVLLSVPIAAAIQEFVSDVLKRKERELKALNS
jgi:predicted PurR-regulated permease PerM